MSLFAHCAQLVGNEGLFLSLEEGATFTLPMHHRYLSIPRKFRSGGVLSDGEEAPPTPLLQVGPLALNL